MKFRITPNTDEFYVLFSQAASNMAAAVRALGELDADRSNAQSKHEAIKSLESKGDDFTRRMLGALDTAFVTPFDREDIHALAEGIDDVLDGVYHISEMMVLIPTKQDLPGFHAQISTLVEAANVTVELVDRLSHMKGTRELVERIDRLESQADGEYRRSLAAMFSGEYETLEVLKWKGLVDAAEAAMDTLEDVADTVASIVVKHA